MTLSTALMAIAKTNISDDQGPWRQFVLDHLDYIAARSTTYTIEPELMNRYRYDLGRFLKERMTIHTDMAWIVLHLNYLPNDLAFDTPGEFIIPTDELCNKLYHSYKASRANPVR